MVSVVSEDVPQPPIESAFRGVVQRGDLVEVMVQRANTSVEDVCFLPAKVWDVVDGGFHVNYLARTDEDQLLHVFESSTEYAPWESINLHIPLSQYDGTPAERQKLAFKRLGYRDLGNQCFYKISDEALVQSHPNLMHRQLEIGVLDSDSDADTEIDEDSSDCEVEQLDEEGNLMDLVVPDAEVDLFTEAVGTAHADMMNRAQDEFDSWVPANASEQRTKDMIEAMDTRIRREESARAWARGRSL